MRASASIVAVVLLLICASAWAERPAASDAAASPAATSSVFWLDHRRGWHFYEDPEALVEGYAPPEPRPSANHDRPRELVEFEQLQKRLEEYRHIAIMRPTEAHVRRYMELEAQVVRRASHFADVAQRIAWSTPSLDMTLEGRPVNATALQVHERELLQARQQSLRKLARSHVVFFFYRSDCPYCRAFAPTLEAFQARHGIQVVPVSLDGGALPGFPAFRRDNGIARALHVTHVPAVFLAEPFAGKITALGHGVLSESQLVERIATVTAPGADDLVPSATRHVSLR